jgi:predicted nucleic acid-binding Zn ribbon protein
VRRLAPRPLSAALRAVLADVEPATALARAQAVWPAVAGPVLAPFAQPVAEREGVLTLACESAVWAQELELVGPDLLGRLNEATRAAAADAVSFKRLRFVVGSPPN